MIALLSVSVFLYLCVGLGVLRLELGLAPRNRRRAVLFGLGWPVIAVLVVACLVACLAAIGFTGDEKW